MSTWQLEEISILIKTLCTHAGPLGLICGKQAKVHETRKHIVREKKDSQNQLQENSWKKGNETRRNQICTLQEAETTEAIGGDTKRKAMAKTKATTKVGREIKSVKDL